MCALRPLGNREGEADDDAEPEDLPNLVRRSAAPRGGASLSSASCDGQDGRIFSCEKAPSAVDGAFVYERTMKMGMCMEERTGGDTRAAGRKWT